MNKEEIYTTARALSFIHSSTFKLENKENKETCTNLFKMLNLNLSKTEQTCLISNVNSLNSYLLSSKQNFKDNIDAFIDCETDTQLLAWELFSRIILFDKDSFNENSFNEDCQWLDDQWLDNYDFVNDLYMFKYNRSNSSKKWITKLFNWIITNKQSNLHAYYINHLRWFLVIAWNADIQNPGQNNIHEIIQLIKNGIGEDPKYITCFNEISKEFIVPTNSTKKIEYSDLLNVFRTVQVSRTT
jgi:hypothetical protein